MSDEELMRRAQEARARAYAPYSGYAVGAAVLCADGAVVTAANVENASFGLSLCAERLALAAARTAGHGAPVALAVAANGPDVPLPCGACRQVAWELAPPTLRVLVAVADGTPERYVLRDLLPHPFAFGREGGPL